MRRTPAGQTPVAGGGQAEVAAVTIEWQTEVRVVGLTERVVDLHHHRQVDTVSGGHQRHVSPRELVRLVDGVGVPL